MKPCGYCGGVNEDLSERCCVCGTDLADHLGSVEFGPAPDPTFVQSESRPSRYLGLLKVNWWLVLITASVTLFAWAVAPEVRNFLFGKRALSENQSSAYEVKYGLPDSPAFRLGVTGFNSAQLTGQITNLFTPPTLRFPGTNPVTLHYKDDTSGYVFIKASIKGVTGLFIVDTGCYVPLLSMNCARQCGILPGNKTNVIHFLLGVEAQVREATNVTIELSPGLTVKWPKVWVETADRPYLGIIDYPTLELLHAVINTEKKTIDLFPDAPKK